VQQSTLPSVAVFAMPYFNSILECQELHAQAATVQWLKDSSTATSMGAEQMAPQEIVVTQQYVQQSTLPSVAVFAMPYFNSILECQELHAQAAKVQWLKISSTTTSVGSEHVAAQEAVVKQEHAQSDTAALAPAKTQECEMSKIASSCVNPTRRTLQPSKSRRRIIGGVVRGPAPTNDVAHRMDTGDAAEEDTKLSKRDSSLTRGYEALGVEFFSMQDKCDTLDQTIGLASLPKPSRREGPCSSRNRSVPACMMDLGIGTSNRSDWAPSKASPARSATPGSLSKSLSLGALKAIKVTKGGLLPEVSSGGKLLPVIGQRQHSAGTVAWCSHMARSSARAVDLGGPIAFRF
jgi:hypothetical protein